MPMAMLILLLAALAGGYWLGRRPRREGDQTVSGGSPEEESEAASPATAVASDPAGIAPVSSNLYDFETLSSLSVAGCWQLKLECNAPENYCRVTAESSPLEGDQGGDASGRTGDPLRWKAPSDAADDDRDPYQGAAVATERAGRQHDDG
ncbi:MAG: hypothetical protein L6W00_11725 [Lentisphaeria bacterium]|nr:MAG: hypothetical protein L6W00_11725 [Lentisphaeria bacterium]